MMYVRCPLSLRNVEDLLAERGIDISHETVRFWWNRFPPVFAAKIRKKRVAHMQAILSGGGIWKSVCEGQPKPRYLWRAVDHEGEVFRSRHRKTKQGGGGKLYPSAS